ncbi:NAD(P)/FAD-dependent oxidoreductase [Patescibacteria group bacterium]|nr:NAD(P)/FAD-dependent oxidoreductase [Patescibacteria group bacterium]
MKIGIIGAGFTGLSAAYELAKNGHEVSVFEKDSKPGGLAIGYKEPGWEWTLEKHYHHWFTNDRNILNLAKEINYKVLTNRPKTSVYVDGNLYQLDSPRSVLLFPRLSVFDRFRMAGVIGILRYFPFWKLLEGIKTEEFLSKTMGEKAYEKIWEPQLKNKFGNFTKDIALSWFWARIKKRTPSLAYPQGGFLAFAQTLVAKIEKAGGKFYFDTEVKELKSQNSKVKIIIQNSKVSDYDFDKVIVTLPSFFFTKITPDLPKEYKDKLLSLKGLGAINLVLRLKEKFLKDGTYWLSVCDKKSPIMAIVEHTNFMDNRHYNNEHIVYLGNYLPSDHPYMKKTADELLKIYDSYLRKINRNYKSSIINFELFKVPFAQPIIPLNYSKTIPSFKTPLRNVYLANIQQVYPWDRGTNYAVELGKKVAKLISFDE